MNCINFNPNGASFLDINSQNAPKGILSRNPCLRAVIMSIMPQLAQLYTFNLSFTGSEQIINRLVPRWHTYKGLILKETDPLQDASS